jgi:hypothetical protein
MQDFEHWSSDSGRAGDERKITVDAFSEIKHTLQKSLSLGKRRACILCQFGGAGYVRRIKSDLEDSAPGLSLEELRALYETHLKHCPLNFTDAGWKLPLKGGIGFLSTEGAI